MHPTLGGSPPPSLGLTGSTNLTRPLSLQKKIELWWKASHSLDLKLCDQLLQTQ